MFVNLNNIPTGVLAAIAAASWVAAGVLLWRLLPPTMPRTVAVPIAVGIGILYLAITAALKQRGVRVTELLSIDLTWTMLLALAGQRERWQRANAIAEKYGKDSKEARAAALPFVLRILGAVAFILVASVVTFRGSGI
jgi:hypothetical protein